MVLTRQRYTFDDVLVLPDDGRFYELLDGELFAVTSPDNDHGDVLMALIGWLLRAQQAGHGRVRTAPSAVILDPSIRRENAPEPDLFFVSKEALGILTGRFVEGIPDLVIEVLSESTRQRDLPGGKKWEIYERFAVPAYWIVDIETRTVAQYTWQQGRYDQPVLVRRGGVLSSPLFPDILLPIDELFADVRQPGQPLRGRNPFQIAQRPRTLDDGGR